MSQLPYQSELPDQTEKYNSNNAGLFSKSLASARKFVAPALASLAMLYASGCTTTRNMSYDDVTAPSGKYNTLTQQMQAVRNPTVVSSHSNFEPSELETMLPGGVNPNADLEWSAYELNQKQHDPLNPRMAGFAVASDTPTIPVLSYTIETDPTRKGVGVAQAYTINMTISLIPQTALKDMNNPTVVSISNTNNMFYYDSAVALLSGGAYIATGGQTGTGAIIAAVSGATRNGIRYHQDSNNEKTSLHLYNGIYHNSLSDPSADKDSELVQRIAGDFGTHVSFAKTNAPNNNSAVYFFTNDQDALGNLNITPGNGKVQVRDSQNPNQSKEYKVSQYTVTQNYTTEAEYSGIIEILLSGIAGSLYNANTQSGNSGFQLQVGQGGPGGQ